jgi:hypothetical protein
MLANHSATLPCRSMGEVVYNIVLMFTVKQSARTRYHAAILHVAPSYECTVLDEGLNRSTTIYFCCMRRCTAAGVQRLTTGCSSLLRCATVASQPAAFCRRRTAWHTITAAWCNCLVHADGELKGDPTMCILVGACPFSSRCGWRHAPQAHDIQRGKPGLQSQNHQL